MSEKINEMFSRIYKKYDFMDHILSCNVDIFWRKKAVKETIKGLKSYKSYKLLDVASGTGDLAIEIKHASIKKKQGKGIDIYAIDSNNDMLNVAIHKAKKMNLPIHFKVGDALAIDFPADSFDMLTSSFALRDFDDLEKFVQEAKRVLKKGAKIILMDMSNPKGKFSKLFFNLYVKIMILEDSLADKDAYSFLINSIHSFDEQRLIEIMKNQGFKNIKVIKLCPYVTFLLTAEKN
ncbi:MAG: ubiquinone/menaquinone biosynthesis methyltransferase [bacterium]